MKRILQLASLLLCVAMLNSCGLVGGLLNSVGRVAQSALRTVGM